MIEPSQTRRLLAQIADHLVTAEYGATALTRNDWETSHKSFSFEVTAEGLTYNIVRMVNAHSENNETDERLMIRFRNAESNVNYFQFVERFRYIKEPGTPPSFKWASLADQSFFQSSKHVDVLTIVAVPIELPQATVQTIAGYRLSKIAELPKRFALLSNIYIAHAEHNAGMLKLALEPC